MGHFLTFWHYKDLHAHLVYFHLSPRFGHFPNDLAFYWKMVLETKIWVLGVLIAVRVLLLLGPLS